MTKVMKAKCTIQLQYNNTHIYIYICFKVVPEVTQLLALGHAAIDDAVSDVTGVSELVALNLDLHGQLSGRREDQGNGSVTGAKELL